MASRVIRAARIAWSIADTIRAAHWARISSGVIIGRILDTISGRGRSRITKGERSMLSTVFRWAKVIWLKPKRRSKRAEVLLDLAAVTIPLNGMLCLRKLAKE